MRIGKRSTSLYYGWTITWTFALTKTVSWGILHYAFSALLAPMQQEFAWSATAITGAYSLSLLTSGLAALLIGRWLDAHGPRALMTAGSVAGTILVLAWSRVETLTGFYLLWIGIGLASAATLYEPAFTTLAHWFERDRARAMLIVTIAAGFASTIFLPLTGWLVESNGWRSALVILAVVLGVTTIPAHALLLRRRPEDLGLSLDGRCCANNNAGVVSENRVSTGAPPRMMRDADFRWMTLAFFLHTLALIAISVHLIAYLTERGDGAIFAATVAGLIGAAQVAARIITTILDQRVSLITLTAIVFLLQAVALVILVTWHHPVGVIAAVVLLGMGRGAVTLIRPSLIIDLYGRARFGAINGIQALFVTSGRALAPVAAGAGYTITVGYPPVIWVLVVISLLATVAMLRVSKPRSATAAVAG
jgi:MFS family permease